MKLAAAFSFVKFLFNKINFSNLLLLFSFIFSFIFVNSAFSNETSHIGIYGSAKSYDERDLSEDTIMAQSGFMIGIAGRADKITDEIYFGSKGRIGWGQVDYTSKDTGTMKDISDYHIEGSFYGGPTFGEKDQFALYIGLGARYLYNASGYRLSTTGHAGYDRISRYLYAPIGIRISNINSNRVTVFNLEYDYFIQGIQESKLSQAGSSYRDVTHSQDSGYGIKLTAGFFDVQKNKGGFEIYSDLWDIDDSKPASGFYEPRNVTTEFGIRIYF